MIVQPEYVSLDTATLGRLTKDFWSEHKQRRSEARKFIDELTEMNVCIILSFTHLQELFRHERDEIVRDRFAFLARLPLIAWPRPYNKSWFTGAMTDIGAAELHSFVHDGVRGLASIRDQVRESFWETGVGSDLFVADNEVWEPFIEQCRESLEKDRYVVSFSRTDPSGVNGRTIGEIKQEILVAPTNLDQRARRLAGDLTKQVRSSGDKNVKDLDRHAIDFAIQTRDRVRSMLARGDDFTFQVCKQFGVPECLASDGMTIGELGELGTLTEKLKILGQNLRPPVDVDLLDVPPGSLPMLTFDRSLHQIQQSADRVAGSDLGDTSLACLSMYADATEVDKRTAEYLNRVQRNGSPISDLIGPVFKTTEPAMMLLRIREALEETGR